MKTVRKPSVAPVYAVAVVWLLYSVGFGLHSVPQLVLCSVISLCAYLIFKSAFPGETIQVEVPEPAPDTGNPALDEAILQGRESIRKIRLLNAKIPDAKISNLLTDLEKTTAKIFRQLESNGEQLRQCRQFLNYYLPTTIRLLERYVQLQELDMQDGNLNDTMRKIESTLVSVQAAFHKQLDRLFASDVVDINAEITVMEQMLRSQGLTDETEL